MPRMGRVVLPNYPHHIVQRGHNRQVVFASPEDYQRYIGDLRELKEAFGVKVYAYCLMTNHIHLLVTPTESAAGLGQLMKALAARATRYRNRIERRTGTLWEGRYKSSVVQSERYLLACCRYIELNPVRADIVASAADYPWSSYNARVGCSPDNDWLDIDDCFDVLGDTKQDRQESYKSFVNQAVSSDELKTIRLALQRGQLTGTTRFIDEVERIAGIRIAYRGQGRPWHDR
ncbi:MULTISPECIES: REP-associated tyrosine transposase [Pseudomonas]|uniref:REP-associated tyrosine transposase n=1 Tax=Pseudomonas TaxID=286 RepID=UPI000C07D36F|nr:MULTISPECIES: transposase [Pseudomonas]MBH3424641.1 transposase [Pseudomonas gessardii]NNA70108.1 transposase [Pseudomonas gessardii]